MNESKKKDGGERRFDQSSKNKESQKRKIDERKIEQSDKD